ncbi:hypothetical protein E2C01_056906 [Portunus trituberculatus]|uniref:Uncharacterized protein n=1 Tax=Portunus trituberculatus TaxID=210409 RepID=A0A5B7GYX8_PORTR|nr:hypothetical protein [Portunus trituberculatus]
MPEEERTTPLPPYDIVSGVPKHSFKTVADAYWGYHQLELDKEIDFVGWKGYKLTDEHLVAVNNSSMPDKPSISDIRSWYRFMN